MRGDWQICGVSRWPSSAASFCFRVAGSDTSVAIVPSDSWHSRSRGDRHNRQDNNPLAGMERVALMERLGRSFSGGIETQGPPAWHDAELESRNGEWASHDYSTATINFLLGRVKGWGLTPFSQSVRLALLTDRIPVNLVPRAREIPGQTGIPNPSCRA